MTRKPRERSMSYQILKRAYEGARQLESEGYKVFGPVQSPATGRWIVRYVPKRVKASMSNPRGKVLIYDQVLRVTARKGQSHQCSPECARKDHCYYHDFKPGARMYGLPDKSILIKA